MIEAFKIEKVEDHPTIPYLSNVYFGEHQTISSYTEEGKPRYKVGDVVIFVPDGWIVPEFLLRMGYWNEEKRKGILAGSKGNRVKARITDTVRSEGIMFPVVFENFDDYNSIAKVGGVQIAERSLMWDDALFKTDFSVELSIMKWEPA